MGNVASILMDSSNMDVTVKNKHGFNCVHQAVLKGKTEWVRQKSYPIIPDSHACTSMWSRMLRLFYIYVHAPAYYRIYTRTSVYKLVQILCMSKGENKKTNYLKMGSYDRFTEMLHTIRLVWNSFCLTEIHQFCLHQRILIYFCTYIKALATYITSGMQLWGSS